MATSPPDEGAFRWMQGEGEVLASLCVLRLRLQSINGWPQGITEVHSRPVVRGLWIRICALCRPRPCLYYLCALALSPPLVSINSGHPIGSFYEPNGLFKDSRTLEKPGVRCAIHDCWSPASRKRIPEQMEIAALVHIWRGAP